MVNYYKPKRESNYVNFLLDTKVLSANFHLQLLPNKIYKPIIG